MKISRFLSFVFLPILLGCSARDEAAAPPPAKVAAINPVPAPVVATTVQAAVVTPVIPSVPTDPALPAPVTPMPGLSAPSVAVSGDVPASETWNAIKGDTYDQRADFAAGLERIATRVDNAIQILTAKRSTLPETSTQDWDFAMKELGEARTNLRYQFTELNKATPETWNETKDRVGGAWQRVRDDYDQVKLSTTI